MTQLTMEQKAALYDSIRPEIRKLAHQMEIKFRIHDNDRGNPFDCKDDVFMQERHLGELHELDEEIKDCAQPSKVWGEGADTCNFILMRIINHERQWRQKFIGKVPQ